MKNSQVLNERTLSSKLFKNIFHRSAPNNIIVWQVGMFSPAAKAGIQPGDSVILVNDWKVEAMNNVPAALAVLLAAGFTVNLGWAKTDLSTEGWEHLEDV